MAVVTMSSNDRDHVRRKTRWIGRKRTNKVLGDGAVVIGAVLVALAHLYTFAHLPISIAEGIQC
jgi:hypothetical protein